MHRTFRTTLGFVFFGIGCFCLWQAVSPGLTQKPQLASVAQAEVSFVESLPSGTVVTTPIQDVRVGQRVLAHNPEVDHQERRSRGLEPDFRQWLYLQLEMPKEDGSVLHIKLLRPQEWFDAQVRYVIDDGKSGGGKTQSRSSSVPSIVGRNKEQRDEAPAMAVENGENIAGTALRSVRPTVSALSALTPLVPMSPLRPVFFDLAVATALIEEAGSELIGLTVELDLPEMGASGTAVVTRILPTPSIEPQVDHHDDRQVVTATFRHPPSTQVLDVMFTSEAEWNDRGANGRAGSYRPISGPQGTRPVGTGPTAATSQGSASSSSSASSIGVTCNHLFWSVDRQEFVEIGQMDLGERVRTYHGETKRLASKLPRPGPPQEVYNLEVYGEHVYFVGNEQLLAHNNCKIVGLGLRKHLDGLRKRFGVSTYEDLHRVGLSVDDLNKVDDGAVFLSNIRHAVKNSDGVLFDLTDVDFAKVAREGIRKSTVLNVNTTSRELLAVIELAPELQRAGKSIRFLKHGEFVNLADEIGNSLFRTTGSSDAFEHLRLLGELR